MYRIVTSFLFVVIPFLLQAQEPCGFDKVHKLMMQQNPAYRQSVERMETNWATSMLGPKERLIINGTDTVYEIPVVFHVIHTGGAIGTAFNPTDAQLIALIDYMNQSYQALWASYPPVGAGGVYVPFRFVLAKRDPNCAPTTGINRVDGSGVPNYVAQGIEVSGPPGASEVAVKNLSVWPNDKYYNIWVVNKIGNGGGVAGYAYFPGAGAPLDGTVILASSAVAGSSTLVHELGHGMGLYHTFEGDGGGGVCPPNADCTLDGDRLCDTEPHKRGVSCSDITNPCTGLSFNFTHFNFMSYTSGACRNRFTPDQKKRMVNSLKAIRTSLMNSIGAVPVLPAPTTASCIPTIINGSSVLNAGVHLVNFNTISKASGGFTSEGVYVDNFCENRTEVYTGNSYSIAVKTGPQVENVSVFLDYNNDGQFQPTELIFSNNGTSANQTHFGTVAIPVSAPVLCQPLRMRVVSDVATAPAPDACSALAHGQAEDYVVTIKPPTSASLNSVVSSSFPGCIDSLVTFLTTGTNVPGGSVITWLVNGIQSGTGFTFNSYTLQPGDIVQSMTYVPNSLCPTPDTIKSNSLTVNVLPGPPAPIISFIGTDLVSNVSPVLWFGPDGLIPGVNGPVYHPTKIGNYYAVVQGNPCPSDKSNILLVNWLGLGEYSFENVKIFPNPADKDLVIDWNNTPANVQLDVYSALGQLLLHDEVRNQSRKSIGISHLADGIYFLKLTDNSGKSGVMKIQVQH